MRRSWPREDESEEADHLGGGTALQRDRKGDRCSTAGLEGEPLRELRGEDEEVEERRDERRDSNLLRRRMGGKEEKGGLKIEEGVSKI
jgi:hypothetical protein